MNQLVPAHREHLSKAEATRVEKALRSSVSANTRRAYSKAIERFLVELDGRPVNDITTSAYLAGMMDDGYAPSTIRQAAAAVGAWARATNTPDPRGSLTQQTLRGAVRANRKNGRGQVDPLDRHDMELAARKAARSKTTAGLRDCAVLRVMSDGLLRVSELAALQVEDVLREADGSGRIVIRQSKVDQEAKGSVLYLGKPTMKAIDAWLAAAREQRDDYTTGPLFRRVSRTGVVIGCAPLSANAVRAVIRRRAADAGIEGRISGHSLRVGMAQTLVANGAGLAELRQAGRWRDAPTAAGYAANELAGRGAVARLVYGRRSK